MMAKWIITPKEALVLSWLIATTISSKEKDQACKRITQARKIIDRAEMRLKSLTKKSKLQQRKRS